MELNDFLKMLRDYFDKGKRVLLYIFFFVCLLIYYLPVSELKLKLLAPFIFAATFIVIDMLSKLSSTVDKKLDSFDYIPNEQEAYKRVSDELHKLCRKRKNISNTLTVKVLGLRGRHVTAWLNSLIGHHKKDDWFVNISFEYYLIDRDFAKTIVGLEKYALNIEASAHLVKDLSQKCKSDKTLKANGISVQLFTYNAVNPFQAFLIGEHNLVLSYVMPEIIAGKVADWIGPERNPYYHYKRDEEQNRFMFEVIERWLVFYGRSVAANDETHG